MSRFSSREVRISWYPIFFFSFVYFSRGTLPTRKRGEKGTTGGPSCFSPGLGRGALGVVKWWLAKLSGVRESEVVSSTTTRHDAARLG